MFSNSQNLFSIKSFFPEDTSNTLKDITSYNNGIKLWSWNSLKIATVDLSNEYIKNAVVRTVVDKISTTIGCLEPLIFDTETRKRDKEHPLNIILKRPNREQIWKELIRDLINDQYLYGQYFLYAVMSGKNILSLKRILPSNVSMLDQDTQGNVFNYNIKLGDEIKTVRNLAYNDPRACIFKQTFYNSTSDNFKDNGTSPLESASDAINHIDIANKYNLSFLQNGARPSLAFIVKPEDGYDGYLTDEQREILSKQLNDKYSGSENAGRPILLEGGIEVKNLSSNMKDMDFSELIDLSIQMICMVCGVPGEECGLVKSKSYNSAEESRKAFMLNSIIPFADLLYEKLNSFLMPKYDLTGKFVLTYNKADINLLKKDILDIMVRAKETEAYTTNEVRQINNMDAVEEGDDVRVGMATAPIGATSKNFESNNNKDKEK